MRNYVLSCPEGYFIGWTPGLTSMKMASFSSNIENAVRYMPEELRDAKRPLELLGFLVDDIEIDEDETGKTEMTAFNENGPRKVYAFDLDGTLAIGGPFWEKEPEPNEPMITRLVQLYHQGNIIIIWTARQWEHAPETVAWLTKYRIPFHGIYMSKGGADVYVDDKMVSLEEICQDSK